MRMTETSPDHYRNSLMEIPLGMVSFYIEFVMLILLLLMFAGRYYDYHSHYRYNNNIIIII